MIEIKHRLTGKVLKTVKAYTLAGVDLRKAYLRDADLSETELCEADLRNSNLTGADLRQAVLIIADLNNTDLTNADLNNAELYGADLKDADLSYADLTGANLVNADLSYADLNYTDLSNAVLGYTTFVGCSKLHRATALETVQHKYPSALNAETLRASVEHLPDVFLRGVGYNNEEIETLRALYGKAFRFYSCFISYARSDDEFASRLYSDLQTNNITCWKDTEDLKGGDYWRNQIYEAIRLRDKAILVCSERSLTRPAVIEEILEAIEKEKDGGKKLFPIRIDDFILSDELAKIGKEKTATGDWPANWLSKVRAYHIPDFSGWEDHKRYKPAFDKLLKDLKQA